MINNNFHINTKYSLCPYSIPDRPKIKMEMAFDKVKSDGDLIVKVICESLGNFDVVISTGRGNSSRQPSDVNGSKREEEEITLGKNKNKSITCGGMPGQEESSTATINYHGCLLFSSFIRRKPLIIDAPIVVLNNRH